MKNIYCFKFLIFIFFKIIKWKIWNKKIRFIIQFQIKLISIFFKKTYNSKFEKTSNTISIIISIIISEYYIHPPSIFTPLSSEFRINISMHQKYQIITTNTQGHTDYKINIKWLESWETNFFFLKWCWIKNL